MLQNLIFERVILQALSTTAKTLKTLIPRAVCSLLRKPPRASATPVLPPCSLPRGCHLHRGGGAGSGGSGVGGAAVSVAVTEAAPLQTQLRHSIVGAGRVTAPLGQGGQPGEVDSQVSDLPQLWGPENQIRRAGRRGKKKERRLEAKRRQDAKERNSGLTCPPALPS